MIKKYLSITLIGLLTFAQINVTNVFAVEENNEHGMGNIITDWDNVNVEDFRDDSDVSPGYYPEDHDRWGGVSPGINEDPGLNNGGSSKPLDEINMSTTYKLVNDVCYEVVNKTVNGKTTKTETKTSITNCMTSNNGQPGENGFNDIDLDKIIVDGAKPGVGSNLQEGEEPELETNNATDFEVVTDDDGNFLYLLHKPTGEQFKKGDNIVVNGKTIGTVNEDGTIDSSTNPSAAGYLNTNVQNDLDGLGEGTHALFLTTDKTIENPELIPLNIIVSKDGTISKDDFNKAMELTVEQVNGKIVEDKDRTLYFIDGKLILSTLNKQDTISVNEFPILFESVKTLIVAKPKE